MQNKASGGGKTARFNALVAEHGLTVDDVATLLGRGIKTIYAWKTGNAHAIPDSLLELLELKLASRPKTGGAEQ